MYDGQNVIDLIAELNLTRLLENPIMDNIISNYWEGPYERKYFLEGCSSFKVLKNLYR
jgi:hypothetical protein